MKQKQTDPRERGYRQWLDVLALITSILALGLSGYVFYFAEMRIADDATATVLAITTDSDTNGFEFLRTEIIFRNEGTRPIVIPCVTFALSENTNFTLRVNHVWHRDSPLIVAPKTPILERITFGQGLQDMPMIMPRGYNEPVIHGRLVMDVIDSHNVLHSAEYDAITLQQGTRGLITQWKQPMPHVFHLLPSSAQPVKWYEPMSPKFHREMRLSEISTTTGQFQIELDGPLGFRLPSVFTNEPKHTWPMRPNLGGDSHSTGVNTNKPPPPPPTEKK